MSTPTKRSLDRLRKDGYSCCVVEKWVPSTPKGFKGPIITRDAWNFGDILAVKVGQSGALLVQTTTSNNLAARLAKIRTIAEAGIWLAANNRIIIHGWSRRGARGDRKLWACRSVEVLHDSEVDLGIA